MPALSQKLTRQCIENNSMPEPNSGCWLWLAYEYKGYGRIRREQITHFAHRAAYELYKGPAGNLLVRHLCNNSYCVNPEHLALGTDMDNMRDKIKAGTSRTTKFLTAHMERRLLSKQAREHINELKRQSKSDAEIASILGVSRSTIQRWK